MPDKTTLGISDTFREYIEALVEEVVINGEPFEAQKKWLRKNSEAEGVDYAALEQNLVDFFEVMEEWKKQKSKSSQIATQMLAKECYLSEETQKKLFENKTLEIPDDQLYPIRKDGKWGYMNSKGDIIFMVEADVEHAYGFKENLARVCFKGNHEGFIDKSGKLFIGFEFDRVSDFLNGHSIVVLYGQCGVIDKKGKWVMEPRYTDIKQPFPNMFICDGCIYDIDGQEIELPESVEEFGDVSEGLLSLEQYDYDNDSEKWGFVNTNGEVVIEPYFDKLDNWGFHEGLCAVRVKRKWGFIDRTGKMVIKKQFDEASHFRNGVAIVRKDGKYGVIDKTGKVLFDSNNKINKYHSFDGVDFGIIEDGSNSILVDKTGSKIKVLPRCRIHTNEFGVAEIDICDEHYNHKSGLLNSKGEQVVPCKYEDLRLISDSLASVKMKGKYGLIDTNDCVILEPQYDYIYAYDYGDLLIVSKNGKEGYIDKTGKVIYMES